jgi:DNA-binding HxlR family transcriptional regulator
MGDRRGLPSNIFDPTDRAVHQLLDLLTRSWTYQIVTALSFGGPSRYGRLHKQIEGISQRLLTQRLQELEAWGLIARIREPTSVRNVTYAMTVRSEELQPLFAAFRELVSRWHKQDREPAGREKARKVMKF